MAAEVRNGPWRFRIITRDSDPGFDLPLGFAGGLPEPVLGVVRFGLRDYDPEPGRWLAPDPLLFAAGGWFGDELMASRRREGITRRARPTSR